MTLDALVALFVLALAAAGLYSLMPTVKRGQHLAREESHATQIANRMLEHILLLRPADLNPDTLNQLNLVDPNSTGSPYSITNVALDEGSKYSPASLLKNGKGTMTVTAIDYGSMKVDLEITWTSASGKSRSLQTGTIVGGYK
jgi:type II secretory pathway pseudopilin PulG